MSLSSQNRDKKADGFSMQNKELFEFLFNAMEYDLQLITPDMIACLHLNTLFDLKTNKTRPFITVDYTPKELELKEKIDKGRLEELRNTSCSLYEFKIINGKRESNSERILREKKEGTFEQLEQKRSERNKEWEELHNFEIRKPMKGAVIVFPISNNRFVTVDLGPKVRIWDASDRENFKVVQEIKLPETFVEAIARHDEATMERASGPHHCERYGNYFRNRSYLAFMYAKADPSNPSCFLLVTSFNEFNRMCYVNADTGQVAWEGLLPYRPNNLTFIGKSIVINSGSNSYYIDVSKCDTSTGWLAGDDEFERLITTENPLIFKWPPTNELIVNLHSTYRSNYYPTLGFSQPIDAKNEENLKKLLVDEDTICPMQLSSGELMIVQVPGEKNDAENLGVTLYDPNKQQITSSYVLLGNVYSSQCCPSLGVFDIDCRDFHNGGEKYQINFCGNVSPFQPIAEIKETVDDIRNFIGIPALANLTAEYLGIGAGIKHFNLFKPAEPNTLMQTLQVQAQQTSEQVSKTPQKKTFLSLFLVTCPVSILKLLKF